MGDKPADPLDSTQQSPHQGGGARPRLLPGTMVAHYQLGEPLGEGGMGVVYRAQDQKLGRAVAIKFLASGNDGEEARARFWREARAASALDHLNIGTVYEIGEADGTPFIVMALYEGETLRDRLKRGPLPVDEVVAIAQQLCLALKAAHQAGIVHRDLKPANIMLLADGTVKLLDFGLAKLASVDESSLTRDGTILGTLNYMAPEQLRSGAVDAGADLWALGAVLYEMLSQKSPFGGGAAATVVARILTEDPPPLPKATPADLGAVCLRLLSKDATRRLESASAVHDLLSRRAGPAAGERRGILVGLSVVAVAAAFGVAIVARPPKPEPKPEAAVTAVLPTPSPDAETERFLKMGKHAQTVARGMYARATREFNLGRYPEAAAGYEAAYEVTGDGELLYNIAQSYRLAKNRSRSLFFYKQFLGYLDPKSPLRANVDTRIAELSAPAPSQPSSTADPLREAQIAFNLGRFEEAARLFESGYREKGDLELLFKIGESYLNAGNKSRALFSFRAYHSQGGKDPEAARQIAALEQALRPSPPPQANAPEPPPPEEEAAEDLRTEKRRLETERKKLETRLAEIALQEKQEAAAGELVHQVSAGERAHARKLYQEATAAFNQRHFAEAAQAFEACYRIVNQSGLLYDAGQSYRLAEQYNRARFVFGLFLRTNPSGELRAKVQKLLVDMPKP